jgi:hypothetical protein
MAIERISQNALFCFRIKYSIHDYELVAGDKKVLVISPSAGTEDYFG